MVKRLTSWWLVRGSSTSSPLLTGLHPSHTWPTQNIIHWVLWSNQHDIHSTAVLKRTRDENTKSPRQTSCCSSTRALDTGKSRTSQPRSNLPNQAQFEQGWKIVQAAHQKGLFKWKSPTLLKLLPSKRVWLGWCQSQRCVFFVLSNPRNDLHW